MSLFMKLMIGEWTTALALFGFCALNESGKLLKIRKRIALWLENSAPVRTPEENLESAQQNVA
ncbi:MAG: hypothetical protein WB660_14550 [Candidatus Sulfotelmatobacter sp.]